MQIAKDMQSGEEKQRNGGKDTILIANQLHIAILSLATVYFTCMKKLGVHWPHAINISKCIITGQLVAVELELSVLPLALGRLASPSNPLIDLCILSPTLAINAARAGYLAHI